MKIWLMLAAGFTVAIGSTAQAETKNPAGVNPTHFQCYRVSQAKALRPTAVKLKDQFGAWDAKLGNALMLCNPVSKNGEEIKDEKTHLVCYQIPAKNARKKVIVVHQLGEQQLTVGGTVMLCLPALKKVL